MSEAVDLPNLQDQSAPGSVAAPPSGRERSTDLRRLGAVPVDVSVEIGRTRMTVSDTLGLREGSVIALDRMADEPVDVLVNGRPIARGEVVVIDEQFGLRITAVLDAPSGQDAPSGDEPAVG